MPSKKVMLVTGASRGIGLAIARHHAALGYHVFGTRRDPTPIEGEGLTLLPLEVGDVGSAQRCIERVVGTAGRLDVLVNNAGYDLYGALEETTMQEFVDQVDVNFLGAVRMSKIALPIMREQGGGRIINIGSLGGRVGLPMNAAYAASKFALEGFSESLRLEVSPHRVFVSIVSPAAVATDTLDRSIRVVHEGHGAYEMRRKAMVEHMRNAGKASPVTPQHVARMVQRACEDAVPRLRYAVGTQATWVPRMKSLMSQSRFEWMMQRLFP